MKLLHVGDLHLGKSLGEFNLRDDQEYILDQILEIIKENNIDAVLIAGDVYDKAIPSEDATKLLDRILRRLAEMKIRTFIISGNHDSDDRLNFGSGLFETSNIFISAVFDGKLFMRTLEDDFGEVCIWLLPFVKASQVKHFISDAKIESYEDAVRAILERTDIDEKKRNVLVAHQFVAGKSQDPRLGGSEGPAVQSVGLVEKIGYDCFDAFDYVALGHIHSPQKVGREEVRYAGSILKYHLGEVNDAKSVTIITLGEKGDVDIRLIPLKPMRDIRHLSGPMKKLLDEDNIQGKEDFIYVTLTDEELISDAMSIFRQYYPNTVKIDYDNSHTREIEHVDITRIGQNRSFEELIGDFYQKMYGVEISDEEMSVMKQIAEEEGVI